MAHRQMRWSLRCDYGFNIAIGDRTFINYDCLLLDCNRITIGDEVQIAPDVHIYTATHPIEAKARRSGIEYALPVSTARAKELARAPPRLLFKQGDERHYAGKHELARFSGYAVGQVQPATLSRSEPAVL